VIGGHRRVAFRHGVVLAFDRFFGAGAEEQSTDIDQILLAAAVMITATVVAGSVAKQLNLGSIVALLVVGMALEPHSPRPLLTGHVEELQTVGEIGMILLLFLVGLETKPESLSSMRRLLLGARADAF